VSLIDVVDDLITLQHLADNEADPDRRRSLDAVRSHLAAREHGVKVTDAARALAVSPPTVRSWIEAGVLDSVAGAAPARVEVLSLAAVKGAVDLLREHGHDRNLLVAVMRLLRDRAALAGDDVRDDFGDLAVGRVVPLTDELLDEYVAPRKGERRPRSKSS
jgi:hypothetical protein